MSPPDPPDRDGPATDSGEPGLFRLERGPTGDVVLVVIWGTRELEVGIGAGDFSRALAKLGQVFPCSIRLDDSGGERLA